MPKAIKQLQDKVWLEAEYVEKLRSAEDIAKEVGCDKSAVCRALKKLGIEVRKRTSKYALLNDEEWLRQRYVVDGMSLNEIADLVGSTAGNVGAHLAAKGIETRSGSEALATKYPGGRNGELASNWKGGRRANGVGYILVYVPDHPHATQQGYVMEHRLVMEKELGRYLSPDEDVHHINENVADNRPENLMVVGRSEHKKIHSLLRQNKKMRGLNGILEAAIEKLEADNMLFTNAGQLVSSTSFDISEELAAKGITLGPSAEQLRERERIAKLEAKLAEYERLYGKLDQLSRFD